ncbi:hypothetical protein CYCD_21500 [Tenuifilaceae bacterium CYCD]|nr:hypothetical protein CYCD_21500 [Tenuifilaceae bacterium CYCD]
MESVLKKIEKNRVNLSQICGGGVSTGRALYGTKGGVTLSGTEYADFDDQGCCIISFVSDTGGVFYLDPIC